VFDKLIVAYVVGNLRGRCDALIAVFLKKHTFWDMTLSSSEYFSTFRRIIVLPSSGQDILLGQLISEYKSNIYQEKPTNALILSVF
jgi:hypothetical protein